MVKIPRVVGGPLAKKSAAKRRARSPAWERRAEPWSMISTKATTPVARLGDGTALGATPSRFGAAAGVSSGLTGAVKAPCPISKLPENEADTVRKFHAAGEVCITWPNLSESSEEWVRWFA